MKLKIIVLFLILLLAAGCATEQPSDAGDAAADEVKEVAEVQDTEDTEEPEVYEVPDGETEDYAGEEDVEPKIVKPVEEETAELEDVEEHLLPEVNGARLDIDSWMIQLSEYELDEMLSEDADLYVVDRETLAEEELSPEDLDGYVFAYLNIGEVIKHKDYWNRDWGLGNPSWIDRKTKDKWDNYRAQYWKEPWQMILIDQMDKILVAGYDGVYLDGIDVYSYFKSYSGVNSRGAMIELVKKLSSYAKGKNSDFIVFAQGGLDLTEDEKYLKAIDGYVEEELWYDGSAEINNFLIKDKLARLDDLRKSELVLVLDYPTVKGKVCDLIAKADKHRFMAYAAAVYLDRATKWNCG